VTSRRSLLTGSLGLAGLSALGGCTKPEDVFVSPTGPQVAAVEAARHPGAVRRVSLAPSVVDVDLGGPVVSTWAYGGTVPGRAIRVTAGEQIEAELSNLLPADTSVHWHGIALRNDADGVPMVTQDPVAPGGRYTYRFTAARPGTYWLHPHTGLQLDRGLYAPLIVEDPNEPLRYDHEWIIVVDDWLDGVAGTPDDTLQRLRTSSTMSGMMGAGQRSSILLGDAGDVSYPDFLINGRLPTDPDVLRAKPGDRVRLRIINAAADTAFRVALGEHQLRITHTDGYPITPVTADVLLIGMGERYDAVVTLADGVFPLVALAEGKNATAMGLIRTGGGSAPVSGVRPAELDGRIAAYQQLRADPSVALSARAPDAAIRLRLTGGMMRYDWRFDGRLFDHTRVDHAVTAGQRIRLDFVNTTMMWHPVHLHGHTFAVGDPGGPRKDTVIVLPGQTVNTLFEADNPGRWMIHCHNAYHAEAGMMTLLGYRM
jgi:multicopper oxidase